MATPQINFPLSYRDTVPTLFIEGRVSDSDRWGTISKLADLNFALQDRRTSAHAIEEEATFRLARWEACLPQYQLRLKWRNKPVMQYLPSNWKPRDTSPKKASKQSKKAEAMAKHGIKAATSLMDL